ncbi:hypothetical protein EMEDMD4_230040 [Sinorhizobium medicae]|uniref:Uncharacterized protein n=1 Tax=Sinorhizobium medicae TaxID=110321 RepID=A0A508WYI6_9HYPH|nr:hypothetical protein EMEDMD4_230040 [Sinorhizobium medicae]
MISGELMTTISLSEVHQKVGLTLLVQRRSSARLRLWLLPLCWPNGAIPPRQRTLR